MPSFYSAGIFEIMPMFITRHKYNSVMIEYYLTLQGEEGGMVKIHDYTLLFPSTCNSAWNIGDFDRFH